jgi:5'-phosphate synthase pdxT subunit
MVVGVLALQGAFREHVSSLEGLGVETREVRLPADLAGLKGLVIPGGESTAMSLLARDFGLVGPLKAFGRDHAVWGTCAGAILISRGSSSTGEGPVRLGLMEMDVQRNALGRQVESFRVAIRVAALDSMGLGEAPFPSVFIRAPIIRSVNPDRVEVLARLDDGRIVAARQSRNLATSFHPELTEDDRFHRYFLSLVEARNPRRVDSTPEVAAHQHAERGTVRAS